MKDVKKIIRQGLYIITSLYIGYCVYKFIHFVYSADEIDTGVIVSKSNDEVNIKHGTKTELYLNIQFKKEGFRSIEVDPTTYFKYETGNTVSFKIPKELKIQEFFGIVFTIIIILFIVYIFILWVFEIKLN